MSRVCVKRQETSALGNIKLKMIWYLNRKRWGVCLCVKELKILVHILSQRSIV